MIPKNHVAHDMISLNHMFKKTILVVSSMVIGLSMFILPSSALAANPLLCFSGTTNGGNGGICTLLGGVATLNNSVAINGAAYSGVYTVVSSLSGKTLAQVGTDQLSFTYTGVPTGGAPRISLPIDTDGNGTNVGYAFIGANLCNDGSGLVDAINDPTCDVNYLSVDYPNWTAFAAAFPAVSVGSDSVPFVVADEAGSWTVSNIHLGSIVADNVVTNAATGMTSTNATVNSTNGPTTITGQVLGVSTSNLDSLSSSEIRDLQTRLISLMTELVRLLGIMKSKI